MLDPVLRLPINVFPCEDGHAQECSLLKKVLLAIDKNDVWVADRNFCVVGFTCGVATSGAGFIIRENKKYPSEPLGKEKYIGPEQGTTFHIYLPQAVRLLKGQFPDFYTPEISNTFFSLL